MREYHKKRDFSKTPEPRDDSKLADKLTNIFVVQEHDASHLHYDFRLEIDGRLKSWAVPKGPSLNPNDKRLAVLTEDHPLSYYNFEGTIPEGEYGAGKVIVWDTGKYVNLRSVKMSTAFKQGKIEIELKGKKLQGNFALIRTAQKGSSGKNNWLLIKMKDKFADARTNVTASKNKSVISGKTIKEI